MAPKEMSYTKLKNVKTSKQPEYNIYGIITDMTYKQSYDKTNAVQDEFRFKLKDGTMEDALDVTAFAPAKKIPVVNFIIGRIARFHRLQKHQFKNQDGFYLCGRIGAMSSLLLFDISTNNNIKSDFMPVYRSSLSHTYTSVDDDMINELISKADDIMQSIPEESIPESPPQTVRRSPRKHNTPSPSVVNTPSKTPQRAISHPTPSKRNHAFVEIKDMVPGNPNYYNILCQVVSCYTGTKMGTCILRIWDGTRNGHCPLMGSFKQYPLIYGSKEREAAIAAENKLYEVTCYDEHCSDAANFAPGDYVALVNLHFFVPRTCAFPTLVMHGGEGTLRNENGEMVSAARKIAKITKEEMPTVYGKIEKLIKAYDKDLPPVEDQNHLTQEDIGDTQWDNFLGISSRPNAASVQPSSPFVPQIASDAMLQSQRNTVDVTPKKSNPVPVPSLLGTSVSLTPVPIASQTNRGRSVDPPPAISAIFARRPPRMRILSTPPPAPSPKRACTQQIAPAIQDNISTQAFLERLTTLTPPNDVVNLNDSNEDEFPTLTETQIENMWAEVYAGMLCDNE